MVIYPAKTQFFKFRGAKRRAKNLPRDLKLNIHMEVTSKTRETRFQAFIYITFLNMVKKTCKNNNFEISGEGKRRANFFCRDLKLCIRMEVPSKTPQTKFQAFTYITF